MWLLNFVRVNDSTQIFRKPKERGALSQSSPAISLRGTQYMGEQDQGYGQAKRSCIRMDIFSIWTRPSYIDRMQNFCHPYAIHVWTSDLPCPRRQERNGAGRSSIVPNVKVQ